MRFFTNILLILFFIPLCLIGQRSSTSQEEKGSYINYQNSERAQTNRNQARLERIADNDRERHKRVARTIESRQIAQLSKSSLKFTLPTEDLRIQSNRIYEVPKYETFYLYNNSFPRDAEVHFYNSEID